MKRVFRLFLFYQLLILNSSCTQDVYEKGEGDFSQMTAQLADAHVDAKKYIDYVDTDEGEHLVLNQPVTASFITKADTTYRVSFYYKMSGEKAEPITLGRVLVATPKVIEKMKTDPVRLESMWIGKSAKYLNMGIYLMTGTAQDDNSKQILGCNRDTLMQNADGTKTLRLTFYHDQGGVPQYYSQRTYFSIPLTSVDADSIWLSVNTYDGLVTKKFRNQ
jgi:hypothetical protein